MAGGAARSRAFKTILASAVGAPLRETAREEAGAAGVAMMAAVAVGAFPDMRAACRTWVDPLLGERGSSRSRPHGRLRPALSDLSRARTR